MLFVWMADKTSAILAYCDAIGWGIHPIIDVFEDRALGLTACFPTVTPDQLGLDGFEARFHHGIIMTFAFAANRDPEAMLGDLLLIVA